jgi:ribosomal subunit interface protein
MQIEIQSLNSEVHPRWRAIIQRRAAKLAEFYGRTIRLHVTLVHSTHHLRGNEEVRLLLAVPNDTLRIRKSQANMGDAIQAAFAALERDLQSWINRRRYHVRKSRPVTPPRRATGPESGAPGA